MGNKITFNNLEKVEYATKEAYNSLRTNLQFCGGDIRSIMLTSTLPNEGKSTVAFELARAMAEEGKQVLLLDADLRKSVMLGRYKVSATNKKIGGLSHYLTGQAEIEEILCTTNIPNLQVILTGPISPNPPELFRSKAFETLMKVLHASYDAIIIDSPPLGAVIDAAVIAPQCDGTLFVVESSTISHRMAQDVKKQLEVSGCRILGVVLNKYKARDGKYYGKYGKYGHAE